MSKESANIESVMAKTSKERLKWEKETQRIFAIKVSRLSEKDMVEFLESRESIQAYIKGLIRKDMESKQ